MNFNLISTNINKYQKLLIILIIFIGLFGLAKISHAANNIYLDEVRLYSRVLSLAEIAVQYRAGAARMKVNSPPSAPFGNSGLVGYWSFDGAATNWTSATAGTTNDLSGQANTGTMTNMSRSTSPAIGISGYALSFDGVDDKVQLPNNSTYNFNYTNNFTVSAWINTNSASTYQGIFSTMDSGGNGGYAFQISNGGVLLMVVRDISNASVKNANTTLSAGKWYLATAVFVGPTSITFYLNGVNNGSGNFTLNFASVSSLRYIGFQPNTSSSFNGSIDEVRVYNRALSQSEITDLYRAGARTVKFKQ